MIKRLAFIFMILFASKAESQNWDSVPSNVDNLVEVIMFDSIHNELIVSSKFINYVGNKYVRGICRWNGTRWDSLSSGINTHDTISSVPFGVVASCIPYQGKSLMGGAFSINWWC
jgi:hypothetical protein